MLTYYHSLVFCTNLSTTTVRQFSRVVFGLLAMTGQVTMQICLGKGGSYRGPTQHRYPLGDCLLGVF